MRDYNVRLQRGCGEGAAKNDAGAIDDVKTFHLVKVSNEFTNDHGNSLRMPAVLISSRCLNAGAILAMSSAETFERSNDTFHCLTTGQTSSTNSQVRDRLNKNIGYPPSALSSVARRLCGQIPRCR